MTEYSKPYEIYFCSGNVGKYEHLLLNTQHIESVKIVQKQDIDIVEPQLNSIEEIAIYKAKKAFEILKKPVIVQDSGLVVKELKDFPGPYTKYVSQTIGCTGILKLLEGKRDRSCGFTACLVFIDEAEQVHVFNEHNKAKYWGEIACPEETNFLFDECNDTHDNQVSGTKQLGKLAASWSSSHPNENLWSIFIPLDISFLPNNRKTLAQLSDEEITRYRKSRKSVFKEFGKWLDKKNLIYS